MSKAEKMFNDLGFERYKLKENKIIYILQEHFFKTTIIFNLHTKNVTLSESQISAENEIQLTYVFLDIKELKAITQQMIELGWLE